jgi:hypothetical protein
MRFFLNGTTLQDANLDYPDDMIRCKNLYAVVLQFGMPILTSPPWRQGIRACAGLKNDNSLRIGILKIYQGLERISAAAPERGPPLNARNKNLITPYI